MANEFFFLGLPYLALGALLFGTYYRFTRKAFSVSALSSQMLEGRTLPFGSLPWHLGIFVVFAGHLIVMLVPSLWMGLTASRPFLLAVEGLGFAATLLCVVGMVVLIGRRLTTGSLQRVTTKVDLIISALLLVQVLLGLTVALTERWGAIWSAGTTTPYLWSLVRLEPNMEYVTELPPVMKVHLALAWVIFALVPFSRLVHIFSIPVLYLVRSPQKIVWATRRRFQDQGKVEVAEAGMSRRLLIKGLAGVSSAAALMGVGVLDKLVGFFRGPSLNDQEQTDRLSKRLNQLDNQATQTSLELERMQKDRIEIAELAELQPGQGKYFIDYQMRPALAFMDSETGLPLLISAKCTHLGCTVGNVLNDRGHIVCPCHISYFDIKTGQPSEGPAKAPLDLLPWTVRDASGEVVVQRNAAGELLGEVDRLRGTDPTTLIVEIAKPETT